MAALLLAILTPLTDEELPTEVQIFTRGETDTSKGRYVYDEGAEAMVKAAYERNGTQLHFDYEHQAVTGPWPAPAAGWFDLDFRSDGLWAVNIQWTEKAAKLLADKEYRYHSPFFSYDPTTLQVIELHNVALTNLPATEKPPELVPLSRLALSRRNTMLLKASYSDITNKVQDILGQMTDWDSWIVEIWDDSVVFYLWGKYWECSYTHIDDKVTLGDDAKEVEQTYTDKPGGDIVDLKALAEKLGLEADASEEEVNLALSGLLNERAELVALTGNPDFKASMQQLRVLQGAREQSSEAKPDAKVVAQAELNKLIKQGQDERKIMTPLMLSWAQKQSPASLRVFLSAARPVVGSTTPITPATVEVQALTAAESNVAKILGRKPGRMATLKAARAA